MHSADSLKLKNTFRWAKYQRQTEATITEGIVPTATDGTPVTRSDATQSRPGDPQPQTPIAPATTMTTR